MTNRRKAIRIPCRQCAQVFVEYVTNDFAIDSIFDNPNMKAYERLLRKLQKRQNHPAVVLVQVFHYISHIS